MNDDYREGTRNVGLIATVVVAAVLFVLLVLAQIGLARFSNRILNVPLVIATVLVAGLGIWVGFGLSGQQNALVRRPAQGLGCRAAPVGLARARAARAARRQPRAHRTRERHDEPARTSSGRWSRSAASRTAAACSAMRSAWPTLGHRRLDGGRARLARRLRACPRPRGGACGSRRLHAARSTPTSTTSSSRRGGSTPRSRVGRKRPRSGSPPTRTSAERLASRGMWFGIPLLALAIGTLSVLGLSYRIREYR